MTPTDELRRLLDECGVEWRYKDECTTYWYGTLDGVEWGEWTATEMGGHLHLTFSANGDVVTTEQAIAATLGSVSEKDTDRDSDGCGECHMEQDFRRWDDDLGWLTSYTCSVCGESAILMSDRKPSCCPNCGRKVVVK